MTINFSKKNKNVFFFLKRIFFLIFFLTISCNHKNSQKELSNLSIYGIIIDAKTGKHIPFSQIYLLPKSIPKLCDNNGKFYFNNLDSGFYEIKINIKGYFPYSKKINLAYTFNDPLTIYLNQNSPEREIINKGLIAYWSFDNLNTEDLSGNNNNAVAFNSITYVPGIKGNAVYFPGTQDNNPYSKYIRLPNINFKQMKEFSICLWVYEKGMVNENKPLGGGNSYIIFGDHGKGWLGLVNIWGRPIIDVNLHHQFAVGAYWFKNSEPYKAGITLNMDSLDYRNKWMHYAMTYKDNTLSAFVNGKLVKTLKQNINVVGNDAFLGRVRWNNGRNSASRFIGMMDEVKIYSRALDKNEIYSLFENP